ncbi:hypothetical protein NCLIV_012930 [Neospora caninum Liverpool]|uniref:Uncharacterized protein n=1 Tax=Neospora caninum (strain Liverpool) TaxID=572307 RepID=F0VCY5_NEOCL|nr:hypothetical protein NCLIV_012930 [Neospora caninum Liverpool]CBZ51500.1 hypothetical protein NCLIV_012930 [Neospora caninum Liverpool]CEL65450.1 TPA: hypothetical protein BN1204_012930 [Neospora caninum Liverpool]|eukprot:XP_003881533.1 hypothetical protein NCLIV_012930 [Neospora caninum Liverpool]
MDPATASWAATGAEPAVGEKRKASVVEDENASKALKTVPGTAFPSPGPSLTPSPGLAQLNATQPLLSPSVLSSSYAPRSISSPAAAFVAGAAAVTSVLSAPLLEKPQSLLGGGDSAAAVPGVPGESNGTLPAALPGATGGEHAVDVARAAAAAAAAVSARQAAANSAAKALQMALKTAELIQGPMGSPAAAAPGAELSAQSRHARPVDNPL